MSLSPERAETPAGWRPSGYVNPYRLQPFTPSDAIAALVESDCWSNELNEQARRMGHDCVMLLTVLLGLIALMLIHGAALAGGIA